MLDKVLETIRTLASEKLSIPVFAAKLPQDEGIALQIVADVNEATHYDRKERREFAITFLIKQRSQQSAISIADTLAIFLSRIANFPVLETVTILRVKHVNTQFVDQEPTSKLWIYAVNLDILVYY